MSFKFNWRFFDVEDLQARCQEALTESISQTRRPPPLVAPIQATDIDFGTKAPDVKFHSIASVSLKRTHIIFALKYKGDAKLTLETEIEANMLCDTFNDPRLPSFVRPKIVGALSALQLPFRMTIKEIVLDTLIDVVYTPEGVMLYFHEDPLKSLNIESSMDNFPFVHDIINETMKKQLTISFYEDIPESVWASTSPSRTPPDPFFGARRWSQHLQKFVRYASYVLYTYVPVSRPKISPFNTLALNVNSPNLSHPRAILNRACLSHLKSAKMNNSEIGPLPKLDAYLEECSSIASSSASSFNGSYKRQLKHKRRVINLRNLPAAIASPQQSPQRSNTKSPELGSLSASSEETTPPLKGSLFSEHPLSDLAQSMKASPRASGGRNEVSSRSPRQDSPKPYLRTRSFGRTKGGGASLSKSELSRGSSHLPHTPLFQSAEFATISDDEEEKQFLKSSISLLPPSLTFDHRRFSTPEEALPQARQRPFNKHRTSSLQPNKSGAQSVFAPPEDLPPMPRSPGRYPSTNDLMNKSPEALLNN